MGRVICLSNDKGGVGKTTTSINLASILAADLNRRVLAIDMDPQGNLGVGFGIHPQNVEKTSIQMLVDNQSPIEEFIINVRENLDLIPNRKDPRLFEALLSKANRDNLLNQRLRVVKDRYDFIIIDTPPSMLTPTLNGLAAADEVIIPVDSGAFSLIGVDSVVEYIVGVRQNFDKGELKARLLINNFDGRENLSLSVKSTLEDGYADFLYRTVINKNVTLGVAHGQAKPVRELKTASNGYRDFLNLAKEVCEVYE